MENIHKTMIHARCPINGSWDYYVLRVSTDQFIKCEDLDSIANGQRGACETQERLADDLASLLPSHCKLSLTGQHGQNQDLETWRHGTA